MKNIHDVNLLIFDLDGTILKSDKANLVAIKKVFSDLNVNVSIDINDIRTLLTRSSEYFYSKILPEEKIEVENGTNKLNRRNKPVQKTPQPISEPDTSKGEDAGTEGKQVGRPDGTDNANIRGKRTSPKKPPEIKQ